MVGETGIWKIGYLVAVLAILGTGFIGTASALDLGDPDISVKILAPDEFMPDSTYFIGIKYIVNEVSLFDEPASYPEIFFDAGSAEIVANLSGRFNATNTTHTCTFNLTGKIAEKRNETVVVIIKTISSGSVAMQVTANAHDDDDYDDILTATDSISVPVKDLEELNPNSAEYFKELAEQRKMLFERYLYLVNGTLLSQSEMEKISDEGMQTALFKITSASYEMALDEMIGSAAGAFIDPLVGVDGAYDYMDYTNNMITGFEGNPLLAAVNWMFGWCEWILGQIFLTWNIQSSFDGTGSPTPDEPLNQYISLIDEEITCWETNDFEGLKSILKSEKELHEYSSKYSCVSNSDIIEGAEMYSEDTKNYVKILYESVDKAIDSDCMLIDRYIEPAIEAPAPRFVSVPGANVDLGSGEEYDFVFRIENDGGTANDSYFSLSVSDGLEITGYSSDKTNGEFTIYHEGQSIWYHDEYQIPAEHTLLDWYRPWLGAGEAQTLTVTIKGIADGDQWIKYRLAFNPKLDEMSFVRDPTSGELDQQGWHTYEIDVTVDDVANGRPSADFSFSVDGMSACFASLATDPDDDLLSYYWDFDDGSSSTAESPAHEYGSGGDYDVTLTVTDTKGQSDYETKHVHVNEEPEADFSYYAIGTEVMFTSTSTDDGSIVSWDWDFGDYDAGAGEVVSHEYSSAGSYDVMLTVTDDGGKSDSDTAVVTVTANAAPVADAGCDQSVVPGAVVTLDGSGSSDSDGTVEYYEWQEDGVFLGSGATLESVFAPGVHEITLYVVDDGGKVGSDVVRVEVTAKTWFVDDSGGADFTTIQAAVDAASEGDTIFVWSGSYNENVDVNKTLTLRGEGVEVVTVTAADSGDHVFEVTADYVDISGFSVTGATAGWPDAGFYLNGADNCNISENNASNNYYGIYLLGSYNNTLLNNNASSNSDRGIDLCCSSNNTLTNNALDNNYDGICLIDSSNNTLTGNNASNNNYYGIDLYYSSNNMLTGNIASNNSDVGIGLACSSNNMLTGNTASNNRDSGIRIGSSSNDNILYHNDLITNNLNAYDKSNSQWDSGTEGNYYSDYTGTDADSDGIGESSYPIMGGSNVDHYPLMEPWTGDGYTTLFTLEITSPAAPNITTHSPTITVTGTASDASGIASVTVNGELADGAAGWSTWSKEVTLSEGENTITVVATNNTGGGMTESVTVTYTPTGGTEIAYDDGSAEEGWSMGYNPMKCSPYSDGGKNGYALRMTTPKSEPFTISAIKVFSMRYGDDCKTRFEIWDHDKNTLYSDIVPHSEYSILGPWDCDVPDYATWGSKDVPYVVVSGDFYVVMYTDSTNPEDDIYPDTGVYVCYDKSYSSDRAYVVWDNVLGWGEKTLTWDLCTPQETTNWMIRAVGTGGGVDTIPPELEITSHENGDTAYTSTITIAGTASDASGIASVTVNGEPATGTGNWSANVTLSEGENLITVVATDRAWLNTTAAVTVRYEPLRGDLNSDGALTAADAAIALRMAVRGEYADAADVSGDGCVTSLDALMIMQVAAGRIEL